ncbi:MAG: hypothetical protein KJ626_11625 [Verrucomicrobia bacterium]|nr:hypothetical protein [Verrucomicrobiota bacterium]
MKIEGAIDKVELWAAHPTVVRVPRIVNIPRFRSQKFDTYEAFSAWKKSLQLQLIRDGGAQWTR